MKLKLRLLFFAPFLLLCACQGVEGEKSFNVQNFKGPTSSDHTTILDRQGNEPVNQPGLEAKVWVCKSAGAKKYHYNRDCGGLGPCKHAIEKMAVKKAEAVGLGRCGYGKCK